MKIIIVREPPSYLLLELNTVYDLHLGKNGLCLYNIHGKEVSYHLINEYSELFDETFFDIESI